MTLMGQTTIALGRAIHRNRATVNESRVVFGPNSQKTLFAESNLRATMKQAKNLFATNH